jgi:hypothetical protein
MKRSGARVEPEGPTLGGEKRNETRAGNEMSILEERRAPFARTNERTNERGRSRGDRREGGRSAGGRRDATATATAVGPRERNDVAFVLKKRTRLLPIRPRSRRARRSLRTFPSDANAVVWGAGGGLTWRLQHRVDDEPVVHRARRPVVPEAVRAEGHCPYERTSGWS